jgi:hypothetical protein
VTGDLGWLAAALRTAGGTAAPPPAPRAADWSRLRELAESRGVGAALAVAARRAAWPAIPADAEAALGRALTAARGRHAFFARELAVVLATLDAAAVPVLVLKGAALAELLYPAPELRPYADLDLLIRRGDLERADGALRAAGWARHADEHSWDFDAAFDAATVYDRPGGARVDLHWALLTEPRCGWNAVAAEGVWERAVDVRLAGRAARTPGREDTLLHAASHLAVHHAFSGLPWLWDLALMLERWGAGLDWAALRARAARWRVRTALAWALRRVEAVFGVAAPAPCTPPRGVRSWILGALLRRAGPARLVQLDPVVPLLISDRGRDVLRALGRVAVPERAWLQARYGPDAGSLRAQYLAHVRRLAAVAAATLARRRSP